MTDFDPDPARAMFNAHFGPMPCANTAAADELTRTDRDATAKELAELEDRVMERARQIAREKDFAMDVVCNMDQTLIQAYGHLAVDEANSIVTQSVVGRKFLNAIRDRAIAAARKELGA